MLEVMPYPYSLPREEWPSRTLYYHLHEGVLYAQSYVMLYDRLFMVDTGITYNDDNSDSDAQSLTAAAEFGMMIQRARLYKLKYQQKHQLGIWSNR